MNPLQKASARRKAAYLAAILALFTVSIFYRGLEGKEADGTPYVWVPFGRDDGAGPAAAAARGTVLSQARRHELRELEQGDPELAAETAQHMLLGMRGLAVTLLWYDAIDKQKRNDFHLFEKRVKAVTALQPHFITPWIFQSWNIAYNVSVEMHGLGDMYFYIARGIELLAEGERRNRKSPDMRYQIGFYYQNKFSVSDQVQTLRCLYQLSCIPPAERNPDDLVDVRTGEVDPGAFRQFCERHPHLVRRLRGEERRDREKDPRKTGGDTLRTRTPAEVVDFLRANRSVPSRFKSGTELADAARQFPALPQRFNEGPDEAHPGMPPGDDGFSGFGAARAWFTYANALVPPTPRDEAGNPVPWGLPRPGDPAVFGEFDPKKYRIPRMPMLIIFKQGPPRAESYQAEMEQKDGWFDEAGWEVDGGVDEGAAWFTDPAPGGGRQKARVVVGGGRQWSVQAWREAARLWQKSGEENGLIFDESRAVRFREEAGLPPGAPDPLTAPPDLTREQAADPVVFTRHRATNALYYMTSNRNVTNFPYYLAQAAAEGQPETVAARRVLWQADQARRAGNKLEATRLYEAGLAQWKQILLRNPAYHRSERSDRTEEETYEMEMDYLRLIRDDPKVAARAREEFGKAAGKVGLLLPAAVSVAPAIPEASRQDWYTLTAEKFFSPFAEPVKGTNPPDAREGTPWVQEHVKDGVLARMGMPRRTPAQVMVPPPGSIPPTGPPPPGALRPAGVQIGAP